MSKQTQEFETWLATGAKYGTAWEAWQHQAARIAELEAQVKELQRVPLTDEQILQKPWSASNPGTEGYDLDLARFVERAHNIK